MTLEKNLNEIYSRYHGDIRLIKEFLENIDKLLTRRQKLRKKGISDFSEEDKKDLEKFIEFIGSSVEDTKQKSTENSPGASTEMNGTTDTKVTQETTNNRSLTLKSDKLGELIFGLIIPLKQKTFLAEMTLAYLISYQEAFIKEYIKEIMISRRDLLKNKKTITFEEICDFDSMNSLILHMAQEDIDKTLYGGIDDIADYLDKRFGLSLQSEFIDWKIIREASYRRNLIIHNQGITNKIYCFKTGHQKTNERLLTDISYVQNATKAVFSFFDFIHSRMHEKLGMSQPKLIKVTQRKK